MDSYKKKIDRLQEEMEEKRALVAQDHIAIGSYLFANEPGTLGSRKLTEQKDEISRIEAEIERRKQEIEKFKALLDRQQRIDNDIEMHGQEIAQLEESVTPMFEEIGRQAFRIYKENPFVDQQFVDMFSELVKNQEDIRDIDEQLTQLEKATEEKPFLDRMVAKGKLALLRNRRSTREQNTPRLMRKAGKEVTESNFVTVADATALTTAMEPYLEVQTRTDQINRTISDLKNEHVSLDNELAELEAAKKPLRRVADVEQQIESLRGEQDTIYRTTGEIYIAELKKDDQPLQAVADEVERVRSLGKELSDLEKQVERLRAAIAVEEAGDRIAGYQKKIVALEEKITEQQRLVEQYRSEMAAAEAEKSRLEKQRGPLDKL